MIFGQTDSLPIDSTSLTPLLSVGLHTTSDFVHSLDFAIQLASDTPPSFTCRFGSQKYTLTAIVEEHSGKTSKSKEVEATLIYAGGSRYQEAHLVDITECNVGVLCLPQYCSGTESG
jgi:hypothetical protein